MEVFSSTTMCWPSMFLRSKGPHPRSDNHIQSLDSQVNLHMNGVIVLPKVADFNFDQIWITLELNLMIVACMGALSSCRGGDGSSHSTVDEGFAVGASEDQYVWPMNAWECQAVPLFQPMLDWRNLI